MKKNQKDNNRINFTGQSENLLFSSNKLTSAIEVVVTISFGKICINIRVKRYFNWYK